MSSNNKNCGDEILHCAQNDSAENSRILTVMVPADGPAYVTEVENTLETMQSAVGGYIQTVRLTRGIDIVCNEEGHLIGLPENINFPGIVGTFFLISSDCADGEMHGLTKRQAENWCHSINSGVLL